MQIWGNIKTWTIWKRDVSWQGWSEGERITVIASQAPTLEIPHPQVERVEHWGDSSSGGDGYSSRGCTVPFFLQLFVYSYVHLVPEEP